MRKIGALETSDAFWHCMSLVLGLGTLTMPYVLKLLGWFGVIVLALLACLSAHTAKLLCKCIDADSRLKKELVTYADIGEAAFGKKGKRFVNLVLYTDLIASSALFLIFIATNLKEVFAEYLVLQRSTWIIIVAGTLFPTVHLKLSKLSILSKYGSYIMMLLVLGIVYAAVMVPDEQIESNEYHLFQFELSAIGNMVFAFSCHGTLLTIYKEMANPEDANKLFDKVYACGFALKLIVGVCGYYIFANSVSDQISLNLPTTVLRIGVTLFVTLKKWMTYALPLEPVALDLTAIAYQTSKDKTGYGFAFIVRSSLVLATVVIAILLPYFGVFQSLVGALCAGFLVLIFPILFYLKLYGHKISTKDYYSNLAALVFSMVLVGLSSHYSVIKAGETFFGKEDQ